ncbi:GPI transamidase subunit PIG-U family protein [Aphelenchoides avenae]|nr:GPI transamidase subunit PIG-U family protein [Aphelenchus avenae]
MLVAVFSPYPSYAEATIYLALFPAFVELHQFLRFKLIYGGMLCASFTLAPIMWRMWTTTGSGNANFYFAIILVYVVAQIGLMNDLVGAYLRVQVMRNHNIDAEAVKRVKAVRLPLFGRVSNAPASE